MKTLNRTHRFQTLIVLATVLSFGCGKKENTSNAEAENAISAMTSQLKSVQDEYVPESVTDTGTATSAGLGKASSNDICAGVDYIECQPRLIRTYLIYGRAVVGIASNIVEKVSRDLAGAANGTSGTFHDAEKDTTVMYSKRDHMDFDLIILKGSTSVGRVSAQYSKYTIQFNLSELEKDNPNSRGGKLEMKVDYTDRTHWISELTLTEQACQDDKPDNPQNGRIKMTRNEELWTGQAMFYSQVGGAFGSERSCNTAPSDDTGMVTFTDLVSNRQVSKAALYLFKRNETLTNSMDTYGFNNFCENYPDRCQAMATSLNTTPQAVDNYLNSLVNPYCVQRGSSSVVFNSDCSAQSQIVSSQPFLEKSGWLTPLQFSQLQIVIPDHL